MDKLLVIQADRIAAANYMKIVGDNRWSISGILSGGCDNTTIVRLFAAHRIAQITQSDALKIACEALEHIKDSDVGPVRVDPVWAAMSALAAIAALQEQSNG